jgi:hypothetical protein
LDPTPQQAFVSIRPCGSTLGVVVVCVLFDEWAVMGLDCGKHFVLFVGPSSQMSLRAGAQMDLSDVLVGFGVVELETERGPGRILAKPHQAH